MKAVQESRLLLREGRAGIIRRFHNIPGERYPHSCPNSLWKLSLLR